MEDVQSWWEVPAVAHFCYIFRSPFNLFFFEIAELESALLNIQDPDMSISLDHLVTRFLQGCFDKESVNEDNWEEKLHELFDDSFEDNENPLGESYFLHLSPRCKIEVLLKLCELRLDVEGVLEEIKAIPSEDMQAKCLGKDSQNNTYWYFCNERLYRENISLEKKPLQSIKNKNKESDSNKIRQSTRERKSKATPNNDKPWSIACFTISDWEQLSSTLSKSKKAQDKELSAAMKEHLPFLQEQVAEKDRLLRKRFLELAPKRASSRISQVQKTKKLEELKAAEVARKAELKAEEERARKEALLLKQMKESRKRRAEERNKAVEERAERARLREMMRDDTDSDEEEDNRNVVKKIPSPPVKIQVVATSKRKYTKRKLKEETDNNNKSNKECHRNSEPRTHKKTETLKSNKVVIQHNRRLVVRSYSNASKQSENCVTKSNNIIKNNSSTQFSNLSKPSTDTCLNSKPNLYYSSQNIKKFRCNTFKNENSCSSNTSIGRIRMRYSKSAKTGDLSPTQNPANLSSNSCRNSPANNATTPPRIAIYNSNLLSSTPDKSKWNTAFDSKAQKIIFYKSPDNLASKGIKFEKVNFRALPTNGNSPLTKENHVYKPVQFITYGKIIPASTIVKLDYKKPPNQPVTS